MHRFAAHYIFTGDQVLKKAVVATAENGLIYSVSAENAMAIEYSNTIFYNGVICPAFCSAAKTVDLPGLVLHCSDNLDAQIIGDEKIRFIHFDKKDMSSLFLLLEKLQHMGYTFFELLKILTYNNYLALDCKPPIIKPHEVCKLVVLKSLDLIHLRFRYNTRIQVL